MDEALRRLEREDWRRWRVELFRLGRAAECGLAVGDRVAGFDDVMVIGASGKPWTGVVSGFAEAAKPWGHEKPLVGVNREEGLASGALRPRRAAAKSLGSQPQELR